MSVYKRSHKYENSNLKLADLDALLFVNLGQMAVLNVDLDLGALCRLGTDLLLLCCALGSCECEFIRSIFFLELSIYINGAKTEVKFIYGQSKSVFGLSTFSSK